MPNPELRYKEFRTKQGQRSSNLFVINIVQPCRDKTIRLGQLDQRGTEVVGAALMGFSATAVLYLGEKMYFAGRNRRSEEFPRLVEVRPNQEPSRPRGMTPGWAGNPHTEDCGDVYAREGCQRNRCYDLDNRRQSSFDRQASASATWTRSV